MKTIEVNGTKLVVRKPTPKDNRDATIEYSRAFSQAVKGGALMQSDLSKHMRQLGLWDDEKEVRNKEMVKILADGEQKLKRGGIKKSEAKKLAIEMRKARYELFRLLQETTQLNTITAEGIAEQSRFAYLTSVCTLREDGSNYFKDVQDYYEREDSLEAEKAAETLAELVYKVDINFEQKLPENEFLRKYGFADEKLSLVDTKGRYVDTDGRLIDEDGFYVDEAGNKVDRDGKPVEKEAEFVEFLDDDAVIT